MRYETLTALVRDRSPFAAAAFDFNVWPADYLHESWLSHLFDQPVPITLVRAAPARCGVSRHILGRLNLAERFALSFDGVAERLALVDPATLDDLTLSAGAVVNAGRIASAIDRERVRELRADLGEDVYAFAVKRGRMMIGAELAALATGPSRAECVALGEGLLRAAVAGLDAPTRARLLLKLPHGGAPHPAAVPAATLPLFRKLVTARAPRWSWLFD